MSYKTPIIPNLTLKGLDKKIQDIQLLMDSDLTWVEKCFGLADRIVEIKDGKEFIYPAVFESNTVDPIPLLPGDEWGAFAFWVRNGKTTFELNDNFAPKNPIITAQVSCIFYIDIRRISNTTSYKETKATLTAEIFNFFNKVQVGRLIQTDFYEDDITEVFKGFSLDQIDNRFKVYPKWVCRMDFELSFRDTCTATTPTTSWSDLYYTITSGTIYYKRETNTTGGYFKLWYSNDSGVTWEELLELDLTEDSVIIDLVHQYVHTIVGTSYQVSTTGGDILYNT